MADTERQHFLDIIDELSATISRMAEDNRRQAEENQRQTEEYQRQISELTKKIDELTQALNEKNHRKNSRNSSQPPSSDGYNKPAPKSLRKPSGKKPGGQEGHKGSGMAIALPDEEKEYYPSACEGCPCREKCSFDCAGTHYTIDAEITVNTIAHKVMACNCPMRGGDRICGTFPKEAPASKQYGPNIKALAVTMLTQGYVSIDRTKQILEGIGVPISAGTLQNFLNNCAAETQAAAEEIRKKVSSLNVIHCDETGVDINGKLNWMHCMCNKEWSFCTVHEKRGSEAMDEIGIIPSLDNCTLVHDFWYAYLKYPNVRHSFCNTHLERELIYAYETTGQQWADDMNSLLSEMCGKRNELIKTGATEFSKELLDSYNRRYDSLVLTGLEINPIKETAEKNRGRKKKGKTRCLLERLQTYKSDILRFTVDWTVPFTNNEAERCVRFSKVKEKVSGCFRTKKGAEDFMNIMSYIGSAKKHGMSAYTALLEAVNGRSLQIVQSWA